MNKKYLAISSNFSKLEKVEEKTVPKKEKINPVKVFCNGTQIGNVESFEQNRSVHQVRTMDGAVRELIPDRTTTFTMTIANPTFDLAPNSMISVFDSSSNKLMLQGLVQNLEYSSDNQATISGIAV